MAPISASDPRVQELIKALEAYKARNEQLLEELNEKLEKIKKSYLEGVEEIDKNRSQVDIDAELQDL